MKKILFRILGATVLSTVLLSCSDFLTEHPKTFLSPDDFFTTQDQMEAAVNGCYSGLTNIFTGGVGVGVSPWHMLELLTGNIDRTQPGSDEDLGIKLPVKETNIYIGYIWQGAYSAINNCNSVITGISNSEAAVDPAIKNDLLGQVYCLRAWYYFQLVRLYGPVPYLTEQTKDLSEAQVSPASQEEVYEGIVSDLTEAKSLLASWSRTDGYISKGVASGLLAKVYLTMAGFPLSKTENYAKAYDEAKTLVSQKAYSLFGTYADLRNPANENRGEFMLSSQHEADRAGSGMHVSCLPFPVPSSAIDENNAYGGCVIPTLVYYNSYDDADLRKADGQGFFYTHYAALDGSGDVAFSRPYFYKYFDASAVSSGKSGEDYPLLRYADVLLTLAEAKAMADGGTTSDASAIDAYYQVRHRAMPAEIKPSSISFEDVYKERFWEFCCESQSWYDMIRTRKAYKFEGDQIVNMVGYQAPNHDSAFTEADLLFPYPAHDRLLNDNLKK